MTSFSFVDTKNNLKLLANHAIHMLKTDLEKLGSFSEADFQKLIKYLIPRKLNKNEILLNQGQICQSVYFISSGSAYQFRYDDIEENVIDLFLQGEWALNYSSFISQLPSENSIRANSETSVFELDLHTIHFLIAISPVFLQLGKILEGALSKLYYFESAMSPSEKYNHLIHTRPQVLQMFPLKLIASYLNMTPETLSRVRSSF